MYPIELPSDANTCDGEPGLIGLSELELELSELVDGAKVDLRTAEDLSKYFRDDVVRTAALQYAA